ncbi:MAG: hypothetical protein HYY95_05320 [Candidatus Rokubacteria bacterium]|nr:hypothetical protein [Candidatus Rokubacteria bacterium]
MARVLFVVARERAELLGHLTHEFPEGDVSVVMDRRHADRRRNGRRGHAASTSTERRGSERRGVHATAHELRTIGYSIIRLEAPFSPGTPQHPIANATALGQADTYLRDHFRDCTVIASWDPVREGQAFVILTAEGRIVHRVVFTREFLDSYGATMADRIPAVLDEWRLPQHLEHGGRHPVLVTSSGVRLADD